MTFRRNLIALVASLAVATPLVAAASPSVALDSAVFVERIVPGTGRMLAPARSLHSGDRLVYVVDWTRLGGQGGFTLSNPLPRSVYYQGSAMGDEEVSVDGGRTWGKLGTLRIGNRNATPEDVTHLRWRVAPSAAAQGYGRVTYSAIVR